MGDAFSMLAPVLVGFFLGKQIDKFLNVFPWFTLSLTMLGIATGIYSLIKKAYNDNNK